MSVFYEAITLGLAYAMPIGMQNLFVIQQAITNRERLAYFAAACVSIADVSLAMCCVFGVGQLLFALPTLKWLLLLGGSAFILWTAYGLLKSTIQATANATTIPSLSASQIARAAFVLTWFNPHAIADGSILLGTYSSKLQPDQLPTFLFGLSLASPLWFFSLTIVARFSSQLLTPSRMIWVNRAAGVALIILAFSLLKSSFA